MKLILAGSRTVDPTDADIDHAIDSCGVLLAREDIAAIVSGMARDGADPAGVRWAEKNGFDVIKMPVTQEEYKKHGSYLAPKMRNRRLAQEGDVAIVFWDGTSGGTSDLVCRMVARGKWVKVVPMKARERGTRR